MNNILNATIAFLGKTAARDKINRIVTYFPKYLVHAYSEQWDAETISRIQSVSSNVGNARKLMRVGRPLEFVKALVAAQSSTDVVVRVGDSVRQVCLAMWLWHDMWQYFASIKAAIMTKEELSKSKDVGAKFWLAGLVLGAVLSFYKLQKNLEKMRAAKKSIRERSETDEAAKKDLRKLEATHSKLLRALVKNGLDVFIPASRLDLVPVGDGVVGLIGTFTGFIGIYEELLNLKY